LDRPKRKNVSQPGIFYSRGTSNKSSPNIKEANRFARIKNLFACCISSKMQQAENSLRTAV
jgi:hypothetical protein